MAQTNAASRQHVHPKSIATEIGNPSPTGEVLDESLDYKRASLLITRLHPVLLDLGLDRTIPSNWILPTDRGGVAFGKLTLRQADELVRSLEDVVADRQPTTPQPTIGQLSYWE